MTRDERLTITGNAGEIQHARELLNAHGANARTYAETYADRTNSDYWRRVLRALDRIEKEQQQ